MVARADHGELQRRRVRYQGLGSKPHPVRLRRRSSLETEEAAGEFERHGVIAIRADWTRRDDSISRYLADFGRFGIPFYALYRPGREPYVSSRN